MPMSIILSIGCAAACSTSSEPSHGVTIRELVPQTSPSSAVAPGAPLLQALTSCASQPAVAPFHFPGHRRGAGAPASLLALLGLPVFKYDLTELPGLDNLFCPEDAILRAQNEAASLFGAESTFFLINGSTCGIHASIMATCSPGKTLIVPRNCHMSVFSAMVLAGVVPHYVMPCYNTEWDMACGVRPQDVEKAFVEAEEHNIGAVLITSPTYNGICSDVRRIALICHQHGVPLIVDEAHGAHFKFHTGFPETALEQDADLVVQSTHKVLSSLTQSAMLHVQGGRVDKKVLVKCLQMLQSSSPSYLLLASLDAAREYASGVNGFMVFDQALQLAGTAKRALKQLSGIEVLSSEFIDAKCGCVALDPLRINVGLWKTNYSGFEMDDTLRLKHNVVAELPSLRSITFAISSGTSKSDIESLILAFQFIMQMGSGPICTKLPPIAKAPQDNPRCLLSPREAFFCSTERITAKLACGRICAELICPYPPGIPLLVPGEVITRDAISYLNVVVEQGGTISGASDSSMGTFLVCKDLSGI